MIIDELPAPTGEKWTPECGVRWDRGHSEECAMDAFFRAQQKLHPNMRSAGAMLVCLCPKCVRHTL